jgi:hypothetical protein
MIKIKKPVLLTALALGASIYLTDPIDAYALDYKLSTNSVGWNNGNINEVDLENVKMEISTDSPFKLKTTADRRYDVVANNGEMLLHVEFLDELSSTLTNVVKCEKSNFISEGNIYKDIVIKEGDNFKTISYKLDDRKYVIIVGNDSYITIESMLSDSVIFGNNYLNKFLECITVEFKEG